MDDVLKECKLFHETYSPCPENVAVQLFELNEIMKILLAEMAKIKKIVLPE
jgi:hypothetical protein